MQVHYTMHHQAYVTKLNGEACTTAACWFSMLLASAINWTSATTSQRRSCHGERHGACHTFSGTAAMSFPYLLRPARQPHCTVASKLLP